jgi:RHS repeat-associated protein
VTELSGRTVTYTYDDLYRLTSESIANDPHGITGSATYNYDPVGNRLSRTSTLAPLPSQSQTYDPNDRLTSDTYDNNGNTTSSNGKGYAYTFENYLTSLDGGTVRYVYDGDGNRVAKIAGGVTTNYLVDTNNPTSEAQVVDELQAGAVIRSFTYGHKLISQRIVGGSLSFYQYDGHGSVRQLTNASGAITDAYDYDAFGNLIYRSGTTPNDYLDRGEQLDANLGFYYLRARHLNPANGRFLSLDPLEGLDFEPLTLHKYTYAAADPVNKLDPSGKQFLLEEVTDEEVSATLDAIETATLALERARQAAVAVRVIVGTVLAISTLLQRSDRSAPRPREDDRDNKRHAGSLQAQGNDLQNPPPRMAEFPDLNWGYRNGEGTVSWSWNEPNALPAFEALRHLRDLAEVLTDRQRAKREQAFKEAESFIVRASKGGGVCAPVPPLSFPKNKAKYGVDGVGGPRVDIVINAGCAFVQ